MFNEGANQISFTTAGYPEEKIFPFICRITSEQKIEKLRNPIEDTSTSTNLPDNPTYLLNEVRQAVNFAQLTFENLDESKLKFALVEANRLVASGLFEAQIIPDVSTDPYGEITFSHKSSAGYIDIGVRGVGELSYHVRNDLQPQESVYDDYDWIESNQIVPVKLFNAVTQLRKHL